MKRTILLLFCLLAAIFLHAQETPPAGLKAINAQFYISLPDSTIWQQKGSPYNWHRVAKYSELKTQGLLYLLKSDSAHYITPYYFNTHAALYTASNGVKKVGNDFRLGNTPLSVPTTIDKNNNQFSITDSTIPDFGVYAGYNYQDQFFVKSGSSSISIYRGGNIINGTTSFANATNFYSGLGVTDGTNTQTILNSPGFNTTGNFYLPNLSGDNTLAVQGDTTGLGGKFATASSVNRKADSARLYGSVLPGLGAIYQPKEDQRLSSTNSPTFANVIVKGNTLIGNTPGLAKFSIDGTGTPTYMWEVRKNGVLYSHQVVDEAQGVYGLGLIRGTYLAFEKREGAQDPQARLFMDTTNNQFLIKSYSQADPTYKVAMNISGTGKIFLVAKNFDDTYVYSSPLVIGQSASTATLSIQRKQVADTSTNIAASVDVNNILQTTGNNQTLIGLRVRPNYTFGSNTGTKIYGAQIFGTVVPGVAVASNLGMPGLEYNSVYTQNVLSPTTAPLVLGTTGAQTLRLRTNGVDNLVFAATGNALLQTGGSYTDKGQKLQVEGSVRIRNLATGVLGTDSLMAHNFSTGETVRLSANSFVVNPMTALGDIISGSTSGTVTRLAGNTTTTPKALVQTGDGTNSASPVWTDLSLRYLPLSGGTMTGTINTNAIIPVSNSAYGLGSSTLAYGTAYVTNLAGPLSTDLKITTQGTNNLVFYAALTGTQYGKMFGNTGDWVFGTGTPADNGYRINAATSGTNGFFSAGGMTIDVSGAVTSSGSIQQQSTGLTTTITPKIFTTNTTAATAGVPIQNSGAVRVNGTAYATGTSLSNSLGFDYYVNPTTGATTGALAKWDYFNTTLGTTANAMTLDQSGVLNPKQIHFNTLYQSATASVTPTTDSLGFVDGQKHVSKALIAGSGVIINQTATTVTVSAASSVINQTSGTSATLTSAGVYIPQNAALTTYTLPTTAAVGDIIFINGYGAGGWKVAQNASQIIHGATDTTTGTGGFIASTGRYNCVAIRCVVANTQWVVQSSQGSLTIN